MTPLLSHLLTTVVWIHLECPINPQTYLLNRLKNGKAEWAKPGTFSLGLMAGLRGPQHFHMGLCIFCVYYVYDNLGAVLVVIMPHHRFPAPDRLGPSLSVSPSSGVTPPFAVFLLAEAVTFQLIPTYGWLIHFPFLFLWWVLPILLSLDMSKLSEWELQHSAINTVTL